MTGAELPVVEPPFDGDQTDVSVAGVLLAAGTSSRFGEANKLLEAVDDEPLVRQALDPLLDVGLDPVVVVVGHEADAVRAAVSDRPVGVVENDDYANGQATSVRRGVRAVREYGNGEARSADDEVQSADGEAGIDGVLFGLGDMPDVDRSTVVTLLDAFAADVGDPLVAACDGRRGNPVLFGRRYFDELESVRGDTGGREILLTADGTRLVETGDPGVVRDVDEPGDL